MAYIKVPLNYRTLPKIVDYMKHSGDLTAALPLRTALLAAKDGPASGRLSVPSLLALEMACGWTGVEGRGTGAMVKAGLLKESDAGIFFLGWDAGWRVEQGHILENRRRAQHAINTRWSMSRRYSKNTPSNTPRNTPSMNGSRHGRPTEVISVDE